MKTLFPRVERFVNGNTVTSYVNYSRVTNWQIPFITVTASGTQITTEDGIGITTESGDAIVTE